MSDTLWTEPTKYMKVFLGFLSGTRTIRVRRLYLNHSPPASLESTREAPLDNLDMEKTTHAGETFDASAFEPDQYDDALANLDWLDSVDWSRGPWIDLGVQDYSAARWG